MSLSALVQGFPDSAEYYVLAAISELESEGYLVLTDQQRSKVVELNSSRRKEVLELVQPRFAESTLNPILSSHPRVVHNHASDINTRSVVSLRQGVRAVAIASVFMLAALGIAGITSPSSSLSHPSFIKYSPDFDGQISSDGPATVNGGPVSYGHHVHSATLIVIQYCNETSSVQG